METVLILLCCLLAVTLVVETIWFNFITRKNISKRIDFAYSLLDGKFKLLNDQVESLGTRVTKLGSGLDDVAYKHDSFLDYVMSDIAPRLTAMELNKEQNKSKKEKKIK